MLDAFQLPFVQRGLLELVVFALAAGLLGTWIVLRGLAFYAHAVATASFPGLVLAGGLGFAAPLGALLATALLVVPAATARLWTQRLVPLQAWSVAVALVDGVAGLWLSVEIDVPPGAAIAIVAGGVFVLAALAREVRRSSRRA